MINQIENELMEKEITRNLDGEMFNLISETVALWGIKVDGDLRAVMKKLCVEKFNRGRKEHGENFLDIAYDKESIQEVADLFNYCVQNNSKERVSDKVKEIIHIYNK